MRLRNGRRDAMFGETREKTPAGSWYSTAGILAGHSTYVWSSSMPVTLELEEESITCALATLPRAPELEHFDESPGIA